MSHTLDLLYGVDQSCGFHEFFVSADVKKLLLVQTVGLCLSFRNQLPNQHQQLVAYRQQDQTLEDLKDRIRISNETLVIVGTINGSNSSDDLLFGKDHNDGNDHHTYNVKQYMYQGSSFGILISVHGCHNGRCTGTDIGTQNKVDTCAQTYQTGVSQKHEHTDRNRRALHDHGQNKSD